MSRHRFTKLFALLGLSGLSFATSGCFTGQRPTLNSDSTIPPLSDAAAQDVIDIAEAEFTSPFTVKYSITTRYGGATADASVAFDPSLGISVTIAEVRYLRLSDGTTQTCSTISGDCTAGIDETRVSDRQLTSDFYSEGLIARIRQDVKVSVDNSVASSQDVAQTPATCTSIPVVDSTGLRRDKKYCAFPSLHVVALMDTADLYIEASSVSPTADQALFASA